MKKFTVNPIYSADSEFIWKDNDGALGDSGKFYTWNEITEIWDDLHEKDPTMCKYESFDEWWADTSQWFSKYKLTAI